MMADVTYLLSALSGVAVGFTLGLVGGGGSILAVPLMVYVVGVKNPHIAIGTAALAVAVNALAGLASHARAHNVNWRCGGAYALAGVAGAFAGSSAGKAVDGQHLLLLFALLMLVIAGLKAVGKPVPVNHSPLFAPDAEGAIRTATQAIVLSIVGGVRPAPKP